MIYTKFCNFWLGDDGSVLKGECVCFALFSGSIGICLNFSTDVVFCLGLF